MPTQPLRMRHFQWTHSARWLSAINLLSVVGLCAVSAFMLWQMRLDAARRSEMTSRSLVQVLGRDIARNIEIYDLSLRSVVDGLKLPELAEADPELRQMILFDRAATAENFGHTLVFDRTGKLIISSKSLTPEPLNYADREYFQYHVSHPGNALHISQPLISRLTGRRVLIISRRLSDPDGSFAGVVLGSIYLDYFRQLFAAVGADHAGTVTLHGPGGAIIMREPYDEGVIGRSVSATDSYRRFLDAPEGRFSGPAMVGEGNRDFVFTKVGDLPLHLSIAVAPAEIYAEWWHRALVLGAVVLSLCATTIVLTGLFRRELHQRKAAEQAALDLNVQLEKLATTDALTGLANRRRFDDVLGREWRRAVRNQLPLSLLVLDADYFKGFNDRYGHQRGDEALRLIARSIEVGIASVSDTACRIGGEEFAVILPETDAAGAETVAQRIREAVAGWALPHAGSPLGMLTVSIGLAQIPEIRAVDPVAFVEAADQALYAAKANGRNQVQVRRPDRAGLRLAAG
ncbi:MULTISPECIES: sensor domain-containing diguanylate cyclase [Methylobacterium]|uniref:sensor domain-containing diguanylate cyclase n=1 Tax=Methylobacterium TaxID=407 RepID=UPI00138F0257|nr:MULTISPECIES: sensor domain-containing diguanylate cyclase [Methylobacterium]MCI9880205.1 GGDEF domain-containing protein [Methylobacterium goesingense]